MANPNRRIKTSEGYVLIGDRLAKITDGGGLATLPLLDGTAYETSPQSPLYFDNAAHFRSIQVDNPDGAISIRFWRSMTADDPANMAAIEQAIADGTSIPQPDMTGHKWLPLTNIEHGIQFGIGVSEVPREIIAAARQSRWLKIDPVYGLFTATKFYPTLAGQ